MVHAQRRHAPFRHQSPQQPVRMREDVRILHPQPDEIVDIEKPPIIDLLCRHSPMGEPIRLRLQQSMQQVEAVWFTRRAVSDLEGELDRTAPLLGRDDLRKPIL